MSDLDLFLEQLWPAVYAKADSILTDFKFKLKGDHWQSSNTRKADGTEGSEEGKVYIYSDSPFCLKDYRLPRAMAITTYLQDVERTALSWYEAIKHLAIQVGLELPQKELSKDQIDKYEATALQSELMEAANDFFIASLKDDKAHLEYLDKRGYGDCLDKMGLGVISSKDALKNHLEKVGFNAQGIEDKLISKLNGWIGNTNKLTIPYRDHSGRIKGFAFRDINHTKASPNKKYQYQNELPISKMLFNLWAVRGKDITLVEGLLDALHAKAKGFENVVALGGNNISDEQIELIRQHRIETITICLDGDEGGIKGTENVIDDLIKVKGLKIYVASMPDGTDPDELLRETDGAETFREILAAHKDWHEYLSDKILDGYSKLNAKDKHQRIIKVLKVEAKINNLMEKEDFIKHLISLTSYSIEALNDLISQHEADEQNEQSKKELASELSSITRDVNSGRIDILMASKKLESVSKSIQGKHTPHEESYIELLMPYTEEMHIADLQRNPEGINSGFRIDDDELWIPSGAISVFAAPTGHGKTTFLINVALNIASQGKKIWFFTCEEHRSKIVLKTLNTYANEHLSKNNRRSIDSLLKTGTEYIDRECLDNLEKFKASKKKYYELMQQGYLNFHPSDGYSGGLIKQIEHLKKNYRCRNYSY